MKIARRGLLLGLVGYVVLLLGSLLLLQQDAVADTRWRYVVAVLPLPAAVAIVASSMAAYRASDELSQRIHLQALAASFLGTMLLAFSWGLLEGVGLDKLSGFVYFGLLWGLYLAGLWWANRRYR